MYGGLFSAVLLVLAIACYFAIIEYAKATVQREMSASTSVFTRLWTLKSDALTTNAVLLSRDFGFKSALAGGDSATVDSAFENLKGRVGADEGVIIAADGSALSGATATIAKDTGDILMTTYPYDPVSGIITVKGTAYSTVIAPVLAPDPMGWVVFASRLDAEEMTGLEDLSSIPLEAEILTRDADKRWHSATGGTAANLDAFIEAQIEGEGARIIRSPKGKLIAVAAALPALDEARPSVLMLSYPLDKALAAYQPLLLILLGLGLAALVVIAVASLFLARALTKPMLALRHAAGRLQAGQAELVEVTTRDEMADLGQAFNAMALSIKEREQRILHMAKHDITTDLPNRSAFEDHLEAMLAGGDQPLIYAIGIDRHSHIRSVWGVKAANGVMATLAELLKDTCREGYVARLGADVLGMAIPTKDQAGIIDVAPDFAVTLGYILDARVAIEAQVIEVSVSIGYDAGTPDLTATERAERALIALDQGRAAKLKVAPFDPKTYDELADNLLLTDQLREALENEDMQVYYQPKYDYRTQTVTAAEALVRWDHKERGMVSPQRFVLLAEETGYIRDLTRQVLARSIADQARLKAEGFDLTISVNYSGRLLGDRDYTEKTLALCAKAVGRICLEITETAVIEDPKLGLAAIERFVAAGVEISIDDFGTGLSSLSYLKMIPAQELKIDRSFVIEMEKGNRERLLVRSTIDLAHGLGMKVTAEGVEGDAITAMLAGMGCDMAQGYGIGRPMAYGALSDYLRERIVAEPVVAPAKTRRPARK